MKYFFSAVGLVGSATLIISLVMLFLLLVADKSDLLWAPRGVFCGAVLTSLGLIGLLLIEIRDFLLPEEPSDRP